MGRLDLPCAAWALFGSDKAVFLVGKMLQDIRGRDIATVKWSASQTWEKCFGFAWNSVLLVVD